MVLALSPPTVRTVSSVVAYRDVERNFVLRILTPGGALCMVSRYVWEVRS